MCDVGCMTRVLQPPNTGISMGWGWARDEAANVGDNVIQGNWVNGATGAAAAVCDCPSHVLRRQQLAAAGRGQHLRAWTAASLCNSALVVLHQRMCV